MDEFLVSSVHPASAKRQLANYLQVNLILHIPRRRRCLTCNIAQPESHFRNIAVTTRANHVDASRGMKKCTLCLKLHSRRFYP
ncbi:hypothetical protein K435DRAFT_773000, partial [Dendrothele bispora CBS 962.96]